MAVAPRSVLQVLSGLLVAVCTDPESNSWGCQPRGALLGKTKRSYLHPALKHGHAERCVWFLAVCGAQGCAGGIPWSFRWVR